MSNDTMPSSLTSAFDGNSTIETAEKAGDAVDDVADKTSSAAECRWGYWDCIWNAYKQKDMKRDGYLLTIFLGYLPERLTSWR